MLLSTSVLTELTSFFPSSPLLPTSNPALMSQTWLKAPVCSQAHRSVKSSCCLFSKLLSELLPQECYQSSSCDIKQNKYIVIWTEGDVQIPGTHHTSKHKSHQSGTLIWELDQESVCLIISQAKLEVFRYYKQILDFHLAPQLQIIFNWKMIFSLKSK